MTRHHLRLAARKWARTLHIYLSMLGLMLLVFFAVTGFMLNNRDWFGLDQVVTTIRRGVLPPQLLAAQPADRLAVVEKLRADFHITGALDSFDDAEEELRVTFKSPARKAEAVIRRPDGQCVVTFETRGALARISELHRGEDAGTAWRWVIDVTSVLVLLTTATGVTLWLIMPKWRAWGLAAVVVCLTLSGAIYFVLVP